MRLTVHFITHTIFVQKDIEIYYVKYIALLKAIKHVGIVGKRHIIKEKRAKIMVKSFF